MQKNYLNKFLITILYFFGNKISADSTFDNLNKAFGNQLQPNMTITADNFLIMTTFNINFNEAYGFMFGIWPNVSNPWPKGTLIDLSKFITTYLLYYGFQIIMVPMNGSNYITQHSVAWNSLTGFNIYIFDYNENLINTIFISKAYANVLGSENIGLTGIDIYLNNIVVPSTNTNNVSYNPANQTVSTSSPIYITFTHPVAETKIVRMLELAQAVYKNK